MANGFTMRTCTSLVRVAVVTSLALGLAACSQSAALLTSEPAVPGSRQLASGDISPADAAKAAEHWSKEHAKQPRDATAALNYARSLKAMDRKAEALAVLQASYLYHAQNREYLSEFGRLALEQGQAPLAQQLLERADDPARPDWRVLSGRGVALAQQGQYKAAIPLLERARGLAPTQASVINNLALAYTMDGQAVKAEPLLRQAKAMGRDDPRLRQNLALVLQLQGKKAEATRVAMGERAPAAQPATWAARNAPAAQPALARDIRPSVQRAALRSPASAAPVAGDPEAIMRAAIQAEIAHERSRSRAIATSSVPAR